MKCEKHNEQKILSGKKYRCRSCNKEYQEKWYKNNKALQSKKVLNNKKRNKQINAEFICDYLSKNPCVKCGEKDIIVLEFDHIEDKNYNIAKMIGGGHCLDKIKEEMAKCQVLCANCHRRKTALQQNNYKIRYLN